jgi:hypothetical protein
LFNHLTLLFNVSFIELGMFFIYRRCTPPDGLYGITNRSISVDRVLYRPIGIQEVFTFDLKKQNLVNSYLKFLTICMISLCICQPCVLKRRSGLLDHLTLRFIMFFSTEWHVFYLLPMYTS